MSFEPEYSRRIDTDRFKEINDAIKQQEEKRITPNGHNTILPFFGYKWDTGVYFDGSLPKIIRSNKIEITHQYGNTYQVQRVPNRVVGTALPFLEKYTRSEHDFISAPNSLRELENRFVALFNEKTNDIWKSKYISPNLEEYYKRKKSFKIDTLVALGSLSGLLTVIVFLFTSKFWKIDYHWVLWLKENAMGYMVLFSALCFILAVVIYKQTLSKKGESTKNKWRKKYYRTMTRAYGEEMGAILKDYSIVKAKIENKIY